jgi:hypothetical protein
MDALVPLVVGFVLTTVLGGLLGTYLQRRTWDHQNQAHLRQEDLRHAGDACRAVSELLDKRRYRMLRLFFAVRGRARGTVPAEVLAERFSDYDQVLYEWNDSLNVNLALVGTYFGQRARDWLERAYETYQEAGAQLEDAYREAARGSQPAGLDGLGVRLAELDGIAYRFSVLMMAHLRDGMVGRRAPQPLGPPRLAERD